MRKRKIAFDQAFQLSLFDELNEVTLVDEQEYKEHKEEVSLPETIEHVKKEFEFKIACQDNILEQYPWLRNHQAEDCATIEKRFYVDEHKGIQCTNGTGVGKTFLGLSVANRAWYRGRRNILIVAPTDKKVTDWIADNALKFDTEIRQIENVSSIPLMENGQPGMVATTYANFYQNLELEKYTWDLIIYDESHKLMENGQKKDTKALQKHRIIAGLPNHFKRTVVWDNLQTFKEMSVEKRYEVLKQYTARTKVLFLSASPFAYHHNLLIGDGILWNIRESYKMDDELDLTNSYYTGYNELGPEEEFFVKNLGYRMRTNKLTEPDGGVDQSLMERNFFEKQKKLGAIIGRQIQVDKDYSREFITLDSEIGKQIDEGLSIIESAEFKKANPQLSKLAKYHISWLYKNQLLESIKAKLIIPRIKKHIELGRKVVLFHDYNNSNPGHPFNFDSYLMNPKLRDNNVENDIYYDNNDYSKLIEEIRQFKEDYPHLYNMDVAKHLSSPIIEVKKHFKHRAVLFNGQVSKKERSKNKNNFQDDLSGIDIIVVQRQAGKEGIDLHDKTGVYQRVLIDLGLPRRPTDSIQCEGRTYRDGLMSNSIWEYATIQTIFERNAFANDISSRASTAENFAMGNKARNLKAAFKNGYQNSEEYDPHLEQGKGGKERDFALNDATEFELALTLYYSNLKKTSKNKAKEGTDYYATPEPLGLKIVEWLDIRPKEKVLEPSCGHGAIARFFPGNSENSVVEQSRILMSESRLNIDNVAPENFFEEDFLKHSDMMKYDRIAMNPPFGRSGKDAITHLEKALLKHSRFYYGGGDTYGRYICILPDTSYVNKWLEKLETGELYEEIPKENSYYKGRVKMLCERVKISAEMLLPACTFNRAGTSVLCKIVFIDLINDYNQHKSKKYFNYRDIEKVEVLFNEIENLHIPTYVPAPEEEIFID